MERKDLDSTNSDEGNYDFLYDYDYSGNVDHYMSPDPLNKMDEKADPLYEKLQNLPNLKNSVPKFSDDSDWPNWNKMSQKIEMSNLANLNTYQGSNSNLMRFTKVWNIFLSASIALLAFKVVVVVLPKVLLLLMLLLSTQSSKFVHLFEATQSADCL